LAAKVHDRMPVILDAADYALRLDPAVHGREKLQHLIAPFDAKRVTVRPVSTLANNARNQGPECIEPVKGEG